MLSFRKKNGDKYIAEIYSKKVILGYVVVANMGIQKKSGAYKRISNNIKATRSKTRAAELVKQFKEKFYSYKDK